MFFFVRNDSRIYLVILETSGVHGDERRRGLVSRGSGLRLHHEASGAGRDDVQHGERRAPLAGRGQPVHPDLARPRQVRLALGPHLHLPNRGVPVINQRLDHVQRTAQKQIRAVPEIQIPRVSRICYARPRTGRSVLIKSPEPARIQQWTDERVLLRYCTSSDHIRVLRKLRTDLVRQVGLRVGLRRSRKATAMAAVESSGRRRDGAGERGRLIRFRVPLIHGWLSVVFGWRGTST